MLTQGMMTSNSSEWETPQWLFDQLDTTFHFALDVCATEQNAKCKNYYTIKTNGLAQNWYKGPNVANWMNPPYGREIADWVQKASYYTTVCLLPARTDTRWFHEFIYHKAYIEFIKGRLHFSNSESAAPFPSMIVVFNHQDFIPNL